MQRRHAEPTQVANTTVSISTCVVVSVSSTFIYSENVTNCETTSKHPQTQTCVTESVPWNLQLWQKSLWRCRVRSPVDQVVLCHLWTLCHLWVLENRMILETEGHHRDVQVSFTCSTALHWIFTLDQMLLSAGLVAVNGFYASIFCNSVNEVFKVEII